MFVNPDDVIKSYENYSYKDLLKVRDDLVEDMKNFESDRFDPGMWDSTTPPDEGYEITMTIFIGVLKLMEEKFSESDYPPSYFRVVKNENPDLLVIKRKDDEGNLLSLEKYMEQFELASNDIVENEINDLLDLILKSEDKLFKIDDKENSKEYKEYLQYQEYLNELENLFFKSINNF